MLEIWVDGSHYFNVSRKLYVNMLLFFVAYCVYTIRFSQGLFGILRLASGQQNVVIEMYAMTISNAHVPITKSFGGSPWKAVV